LVGFQTFPNLAFQAPSKTYIWQEGGPGSNTPQQSNNNIRRQKTNNSNTRQRASDNKGRLSEYLNKQQLCKMSNDNTPKLDIYDHDKYD